jgi:cyclic pyranopterin phosphate synthase
MSLPEVPRHPPRRIVPVRDVRVAGAGPSLLALPAPHRLASGSPRTLSRHTAVDDTAAAPEARPTDQHGRALRDLRISVTDRCNFRCGYCMPRAAFGKDHPFLPQPELLQFEEITRAARVMSQLGVRKLRLTGGEPLLRKNLEHLVAQLAALRTPEGAPLSLAMTTNGTLLSRKARALKDAGLQRVTVSLDALDPTLFRQLSDADVHVDDVMAGIREALAVGLGPIKVNMVVQRGVNDDQILPMVRHFRGTGVVLRFIEFMDVGSTNQWRLDRVMPSSEVQDLIHRAHPLRPLAASAHGETARRWAFVDGNGEIGFISSVTQAFCGDCSRLRLSTDGRLYTCLFASQGHDLRAALRAPQPWSDADLANSLGQLWARRDDRYSQLRRTEAQRPADGEASPAMADAAHRIEMSYIGG